MVTLIKLRQIKRTIIRCADGNDPELNEIIQEAVRGLNRLLMRRFGSL